MNTQREKSNPISNNVALMATYATRGIVFTFNNRADAHALIIIEAYQQDNIAFPHALLPLAFYQYK